MRKWLIFSILIGLLAWIAYVAMSDYDHSNEIIYFNGDIITMNDQMPSVEAILVKNGKIIEVGKKANIFKFKTSKTQVIDLQGKTLMPGFFDAHGHFDIATIFYGMVDISGFTHKKAATVWQAIAEAARKTPKGEWIFCKGFDPILTKDLEPPTVQKLDSLAPHNPIILISQTLHFYYANSRALAEVGINSKTPNPSKASYYERDKTGKLTGLVVEQAAFEPFRVKLSERVLKSFAQNTQNLMLDNAKNGITSTVTMGLNINRKNVLRLYEHLSGEKAQPFNNLLVWVGMLPTRQPLLRHFIYLRHQDAKELLPQQAENGDDFFKIMGIKLFYDGSPYIGSMYIRKPYIQSKLTKDGIHLSPNHRGEALLRPEEFKNLVEEYQSQGWRIAMHCQGDRAISEAMEVFEQINQKTPLSAFRHRLEHCLMLPNEWIPAMKKMNITPSFHINHILYYGEALQLDLLGEARTQKILPVNSVATQQIPFSLHGDQPMFEAKPLSLVSTALNRTSESGLLINEKESIAILQALKSVTIDAAWQLHLEKKLGSIEKGKYADLVILAQNPLKTNSQSIAKIEVLETIVAGNTVWPK
jgi:predicted amidohydrolase YtcJ